MRYAEIIAPSVNEGAETITTDTGKTIKVLRNPTRVQFAAAMKSWHNARCILSDDGTLFMCDTWDAYHYQMLMKLGMTTTNSTGFVGYPDAIGLYAHDLGNEAKLRGSKAVARIWGDDPTIREAEPD